jgi:hypothetical protein
MTDTPLAAPGAEAEPNPTIKTASAEIRGMMHDIVSQLNTTGAGAAGAPGKFFPNGIELIYLKVEAGLTDRTKVSLELKIAGEKGLKLTDSVEAPLPPADGAEQ